MTILPKPDDTTRVRRFRRRRLRPGLVVMPVVIALLLAVQFSCEPKTTARDVTLLSLGQYEVFMRVDKKTGSPSMATTAAEVTGISDGLGNPVAVGSGQVTPGKTTFNYVTITKRGMDDYTLGLTAALASGEVLKDVTVSWGVHSGNTTLSFWAMKETFSNAVLVSLVSSGDGDGAKETLKFAFTCLLKEYTPQNKVDGSAGTTVSTSWNVSTNASTPACASGTAPSLKQPWGVLRILDRDSRTREDLSHAGTSSEVQPAVSG